jgi:hypothetical protein
MRNRLSFMRQSQRFNGISLKIRRSFIDIASENHIFRENLSGSRITPLIIGLIFRGRAALMPFTGRLSCRPFRRLARL